MNRAQKRESEKIGRGNKKKNYKKATDGNYIRCLVPPNSELCDGDLFTTSADGNKQVFMAVVLR